MIVYPLLLNNERNQYLIIGIKILIQYYFVWLSCLIVYASVFFFQSFAYVLAHIEDISHLCQIRLQFVIPHRLKLQ